DALPICSQRPPPRGAGPPRRAVWRAPRRASKLPLSRRLAQTQGALGANGAPLTLPDRDQGVAGGRLQKLRRLSTNPSKSSRLNGLRSQGPPDSSRKRPARGESTVAAISARRSSLLPSSARSSNKRMPLSSSEESSQTTKSKRATSSTFRRPISALDTTV